MRYKATYRPGRPVGRDLALTLRTPPRGRIETITEMIEVPAPVPAGLPLIGAKLDWQWTGSDWTLGIVMHGYAGYVAEQNAPLQLYAGYPDIVSSSVMTLPAGTGTLTGITVGYEISTVSGPRPDPMPETLTTDAAGAITLTGIADSGYVWLATDVAGYQPWALWLTPPAAPVVGGTDDRTSDAWWTAADAAWSGTSWEPYDVIESLYFQAEDYAGQWVDYAPTVCRVTLETDATGGVEVEVNTDNSTFFESLGEVDAGTHVIEVALSLGPDAGDWISSLRVSCWGGELFAISSIEFDLGA